MRSLIILDALDIIGFRIFSKVLGKARQLRFWTRPGNHRFSSYFQGFWAKLGSWDSGHGLEIIGFPYVFEGSWPSTAVGILETTWESWVPCIFKGSEPSPAVGILDTAWKISGFLVFSNGQGQARQLGFWTRPGNGRFRCIFKKQHNRH